MLTELKSVITGALYKYHIVLNSLSEKVKKPMKLSGLSPVIVS